MTTPRVSVLMPVRNGLPWLEEALAGLSAQTLRDIEILVLEDGSTDGTPQVLASWPDDRIRVINTGGVGIGAALNIGLREARAALVARQDADDVSRPERLEKQVALLNRDRRIDLVGCVAEYVDGVGQTVNNDWVRTIREQQDVAVAPEQIRDLMPLTCCLTHGSIVARADVLRAAGGYRAEMSPQEDYDLWLRLLPDATFAKLPDRLYRYRVHDAQASSQGKPHNIQQTIGIKLAYLRRLCPGLPRPARLAIAGTGRGVSYYGAVAPDFQFVPIPAAQSSGWDVLVVTEFAEIERYRSALNADAGLTRIGNFFVHHHRLVTG
jgi:glycosyltransferase involved in cell wall biosynthesis